MFKKYLIFLAFACSALAETLALINGRADVSSWDDLSVKTSLAHTIYPLANGEKLLILAPNYRDASKEFSAEINATPLKLAVKKGAYKQEQIAVAKKFSQKAPQESPLAKRIAREYEQASKIYNTTTRKSLLHRAFVPPLDSVITSPFGSARVFNGELKSYHSGTDFRAASGTPIPAANDGVVVLASDRYYAGNSVIIDHGYGVFTQYYHLSQILVKPGQSVARGDIVGLSGATGRVSAAHFHLGVAIKGVSVDPLKFFEAINRYLPEN